jgi:hypothetical protein
MSCDITFKRDLNVVMSASTEKWPYNIISGY